MDLFTWLMVAVLILCAALISLMLWLGAANRVSRKELKECERRRKRRRRRSTDKLSA
jgi:putative copper export protein